jgi:hypothetical protein
MTMLIEGLQAQYEPQYTGEFSPSLGSYYGNTFAPQQQVAPAYSPSSPEMGGLIFDNWEVVSLGVGLVGSIGAYQLTSDQEMPTRVFATAIGFFGGTIVGALGAYLADRALGG